MATDALRQRRGSRQRPELIARLSTETKHSLKTTEFWAMVAVIAGILIASWVVGEEGDGGDAFPAARAWLYVAIVAGAYMVSRGLAKAGSRDPYWADLERELPDGDSERPLTRGRES
jgi:hypothetical protein